MQNARSPNILSRISHRLQASTVQSSDELRRQTLLNAIDENQIDVVHVHTGPLAALIAPICDEANIPLVVHFHGIDAYAPNLTGVAGKNYSELRSIASAVVGVSRHMTKQLVTIGMSAEKVHYAPYFVDPDQFSDSKPSDQPPTFLSVGRFVEKKAPLVTLVAFEELLKTVPTATLVMIGDGPMLTGCQQYARTRGIDSQVQFRGLQPHTEVQLAMKSARCFVQHSVVGSDNDHEGTPVGILEAQMSGLPVVSTRHAGICDVVVDEETGFLVDEFDWQKMSKQMCRLAEDPVRAGEMGTAGRMRVKTNFGFDQTLGKLASVLSHVADGR